MVRISSISHPSQPSDHQQPSTHARTTPLAIHLCAAGWLVSPHLSAAPPLCRVVVVGRCVRVRGAFVPCVRLSLASLAASAPLMHMWDSYTTAQRTTPPPPPLPYSYHVLRAVIYYYTLYIVYICDSVWRSPRGPAQVSRFSALRPMSARREPKAASPTRRGRRRHRQSTAQILLYRAK